MKKIMMALTMLVGMSQAHAQLDTQEVKSAPAWICSMHFKGQATGVKFLLGFYQFNGTGELNCVSASGVHQSYPIKLTMKAKALSPQISFGHMELTGLAADISLFNTDPASLFGNYLVVQGQAAIIGGVGIITAVHTDLSSLSLSLSLQFAKGFGINLGLNKLKIELADSKILPVE